jgi:hypothetical protein
VDFELAHRFDLGSGRVISRVYGTYVADLISDDGQGVAPTSTPRVSSRPAAA